MTIAETQFIDDLVQIISTAEEAESVTNEQVGRIFAFLCARIKELQGEIDATPSIENETTNRIAADQQLTKSISATVASESSARISADDAIKADLAALNSKLETEKTAIARRIDALLSDSASDAIDNFNEIKRFLADFKDSDSLAVMLGDLRQSLTTLQQSFSSQTKAIEKLTPIRIESEDALEAMRLLGLLEEGQIYYIPEED